MEQVAILARVSTQGQDYERQVVELTDYCQRMNWEVVTVFANKVSGATRNADREEISALVEYVKEHHLNRVVCLEISRLGVAVIWSRVSSADQYKHNNSIQTQIDACMEYCTRNGIRVKKSYYGATNESAKVAGEKFLAMVTEVQQDPEVNTIVCYDYDRFSRNASEGIMWKTKLKNDGISLIAINQPIAQDNFMAESIENMMIIVATMDNATRRHRCTEGMKACIQRGEWYSRPPLGYDSRKEGKKHIRLYLFATEVL